MEIQKAHRQNLSLLLKERQGAGRVVLTVKRFEAFFCIVLHIRTTARLLMML